MMHSKGFENKVTAILDSVEMELEKIIEYIVQEVVNCRYHKKHG